MSTKLLLTVLAGLLTSPHALAQAKEGSDDNGTDPTRFTTVAETKFEYLDLGDGYSSAIWRVSYTRPFGGGKYNIRVRVPVAAVDVHGDDSYGVGDGSVEVAHVVGLRRTSAFVAKGELVFDTARRPELGSGQNVFKATLIHARFLEGGHIFAPAVVHSISLWGDDERPKVNSTTLDFYYVPKLADPRNLVTCDPALNFDWENHKQFASIAVTFGRVLGPQLGGKGIIFIKPSAYVGTDRPSRWGLEVGYKVIAF